MPSQLRNLTGDSRKIEAGSLIDYDEFYR